ncbi:hypothetical protein ACFWAP_00815 [Streptomyces goshikiensis]|uniref:hypothetical protein n=1 Tax=Streptomyces goshikiensis TaxID=1942 RepID=UPI003649883A
MSKITTTVMITSPGFFAGEVKRQRLGDAVYRMHSTRVPAGEVFWITSTENGETHSSKVWTTRSTVRSKWNEIVAGSAI